MPCFLRVLCVSAVNNSGEAAVGGIPELRCATSRGLAQRSPGIVTSHQRPSDTKLLVTRRGKAGRARFRSQSRNGSYEDPEIFPLFFGGDERGRARLSTQPRKTGVWKKASRVQGCASLPRAASRTNKCRSTKLQAKGFFDNRIMPESGKVCWDVPSSTEMRNEPNSRGRARWTRSDNDLRPTNPCASHGAPRLRRPLPLTK
jgi:hypothetical protein